MSILFSTFSSRFLEKLLEQIEVTQTQYEQAQRAYKSLGDWLERPKSELRNRAPNVYVQGSFRLGTAIKPSLSDDDLDIDVVCEINGSKAEDTQQLVKNSVGYEVKSYADAHGLSIDKPGNRCWTLLYADGSKFHMDVLPAMPDAEDRRVLLEQRELDTEWTDTSLAITDQRDPNFNKIAPEWPHSNPKGFASWFAEQGGHVYRERRQAIFEDERSGIFDSADDVPMFRVKTPLQGVVQLLKRHRDMMFDSRRDEKPISIIIATLAARCYGSENDLASALFAILFSMDRHIEDRDGVAWVQNPTDPLENFADKWELDPKLEECFYEWLEQARDDFETIAAASSGAALPNCMAKRLGSGYSRALDEAVGPKLEYDLAPSSNSFAVRPVPEIIELAPHRKPAAWAQHPTAKGEVKIVEARAGKSRWRSVRFRSGDKPLPKGCDLRFRAKTTVAKPFDVFWQTTNTGPEAEAKGLQGLRGDIDDVRTEAGGLVRKESTSYTGSHSIECFIVKDGHLVARSGPFVVNIA